jgi:hypothetical protein
VFLANNVNIQGIWGGEAIQEQIFYTAKLKIHLQTYQEYVVKFVKVHGIYEHHLVQQKIMFAILIQRAKPFIAVFQLRSEENEINLYN